MEPPVRVSSPVCVVSGVWKRFGGVQALGGVDLEIHPARVHALLGENGAGKSTLMRILAGAEQPDRGSIAINGRQVRPRNVPEASEHGVAMVFQELSLYPELTVLENLFFSREPRRLGLVSRREMRRIAEPAATRVGLRADLDTRVHDLSLADRQLVEITRALLQDSRILILDEPNSALSAVESERLFSIIQSLRLAGVAIVYVSHRLEEVFRIADTITVLRDGVVVETVAPQSTSVQEIVASIIGHASAPISARVGGAGTGEPLRAVGVTVQGRIQEIDLRASPGEIVGLAGLEGAGVREFLEVVFGARRADAGAVTLPGGQPGPRSIPEAVRAGIALIPADRRASGVMLERSVMDNISQVSAGVLGRFGFLIDPRRVREMVEDQIRSLRIAVASSRSPAGQLSGGNQQKVVLAKWLAADPRVVLLDDPTRGVDVGAKEELFDIVFRLADEGRVILFYSTELSEYQRLCDRVVVFYNGRVCGEIDGADATEHALLEAINLGRVAAA